MPGTRTMYVAGPKGLVGALSGLFTKKPDGINFLGLLMRGQCITLPNNDENTIFCQMSVMDENGKEFVTCGYVSDRFDKEVFAKKPKMQLGGKGVFIRDDKKKTSRNSPHFYRIKLEMI
jgi:hypothetical protein